MSAGWSFLPRGKPGSDTMSGDVPRAVWMDPAELYSAHWSWTPGKVVLGAALKKPGTTDEHLIGLHDNRHLMTIAGSRAGKGTSAIIPNLLTYPGSVLVLDPKGENATETAKRRAAMGQEVYVIDPFGVADVPDEMRSGFNPLADLSPVTDTFIDECDTIADALIVPEPGKENDHWNSSARDVLRGFIAWVVGQPGLTDRSLPAVKRILAGKVEMPAHGDPELTAFENYINEMQLADEVASGIPAEVAARLHNMGEEERGSILSTAMSNISFMDSPPMTRCLSSEGRAPELRQWKYGGMSIYLCLPASILHRHFRFFRLVLNRLLSVIEGDEGNKDTPALMILDEMHVLGHMAVLEKSAALIAGFGVKIWSIWQDINQLKRNYQSSWETFIGNCGLVQVFGLNDLTTLKYVSDRLGRSSALKFSTSDRSAMAQAMGESGESTNLDLSPLLDTHEIAQHFDRDTFYQLLIPTGAPPIYARRVPYWDEAYKDFTT